MLLSKERPPAGARPGTLAIAEVSPPPKIRWMRYTEAMLKESEVPDLATLDAARLPDAVSWIDVQGLGDETVLRALGERFAIHPLALDDVVNGSSRSKAEAYDDHLLVVTSMVRLQGEVEVRPEQLGVLIGPCYVGRRAGRRRLAVSYARALEWPGADPPAQL